MDVVVKVIIDEKEYDRLLEIERRYKDINTNQSGAGDDCHCSKTKVKNIPLSEIVARNAEKHAVETPIAEVLPSITVPAVESTSSTKGEKDKPTTSGSGSSTSEKDMLDELGVARFVHPWYYIGAPHPD